MPRSFSTSPKEKIATKDPRVGAVCRGLCFGIIHKCARIVCFLSVYFVCMGFLRIRVCMVVVYGEFFLRLCGDGGCISVI